LARVSAARPKIADYPFTTLAPSLGVARVDDERTLVVADIPGLIEGAHGGAGLGDRFLRHIERCRLILHLVDPNAEGRSFAQAVDAIDRELALYSPILAEKPQILVLTKQDAVQDAAITREAKREARKRHRTLHVVSAVTGEGLAPLLREAADEVARVAPQVSREELRP
jgi:GTP-binding protein